MTNFASQIVERHNKPEIEVGTSPELILNPIVIHRSEHEKVRIVSFNILAEMFKSKFLTRGCKLNNEGCMKATCQINSHPQAVAFRDCARLAFFSTCARHMPCQMSWLYSKSDTYFEQLYWLSVDRMLCIAGYDRASSQFLENVYQGMEATCSWPPNALSTQLGTSPLIWQYPWYAHPLFPDVLER